MQLRVLSDYLGFGGRLLRLYCDAYFVCLLITNNLSEHCINSLLFFRSISTMNATSLNVTSSFFDEWYARDLSEIQRSVCEMRGVYRKNFALEVYNLKGIRLLALCYLFFSPYNVSFPRT